MSESAGQHELAGCSPEEILVIMLGKQSDQAALGDERACNQVRSIRASLKAFCGWTDKSFDEYVLVRSGVVR